jgi:two-component system, NarL family, invasion response regulator UvrY
VIRVVIADDHPLVRAGLKHVLVDCTDIVFAGEVANGADLARKLREASFDVVLLDMFMPGRSGMELIKQIRSEHPRLPILVLSTHKEDVFALRALKLGASGYLCKDYAAESLVDAIRKVAGGGLFISPAVAELMARDLHRPVQQMLPHKLLSDREFEVFLLIAKGLASSTIAARLNVSIKTVSSHKARIREKTGLGNNAEIVRYALRHGLATDNDTPSSYELQP